MTRDDYQDIVAEVVSAMQMGRDHRGAPGVIEDFEKDVVKRVREKAFADAEQKYKDAMVCMNREIGTLKHTCEERSRLLEEAQAASAKKSKTITKQAEELKALRLRYGAVNQSVLDALAHSRSAVFALELLLEETVQDWDIK